MTLPSPVTRFIATYLSCMTSLAAFAVPASEMYYDVDRCVELAEWRVEGPLCGLMALGAAANSLGYEDSPAKWLDRRYISSVAGSSVADLKLAVDRMGLHAKAFTRLSLDDLRSSSSPILLHVSGSGQGPMSQHWVTYLGVDGKLLRTYDSRTGLRSVRAANLLAQWDGVGIVVDRDPVSRLRVLSYGRAWRFTWWLSCAVALAISNCIVSCFQYTCASRTLRDATVILGLVFVLSTTRNAVSDSGFARNRAAVGYLARQAITASFAEIQADELERMMQDDSHHLFVDARLADDFSKGAISGSINIPIDSAPFSIADQLADVPKSSRVVVYCQSRDCDYSDRIALEIAALGYSNVRIYRDGWRDWKSRAARAQVNSSKRENGDS